jgi:hypothetical protein
MKNLVTFCVIEGIPEHSGWTDKGYTYWHQVVKDYKIFIEEIDVNLNIGDSVVSGDYKSVIISRTYEIESKRWLYYGKDIWTDKPIKIKENLEETDLSKLFNRI